MQRRGARPVSVPLRRLFLASLLRRRLASALSLLAIALGVALGLAVHLIHGAALDEFARDGEHWYEDDEGVVIREISKFSRLFDVSPVTYPAYQEADSGVRSMKAWQEARDSGALHNAINQRMARERLLTLLNA